MYNIIRGASSKRISVYHTLVFHYHLIYIGDLTTNITITMIWVLQNSNIFHVFPMRVRDIVHLIIIMDCLLESVMQD